MFTLAPLRILAADNDTVSDGACLDSLDLHYSCNLHRGTVNLSRSWTIHLPSRPQASHLHNPLVVTIAWWLLWHILVTFLCLACSSAQSRQSLSATLYRYTTTSWPLDSCSRVFCPSYFSNPPKFHVGKRNAPGPVQARPRSLLLSPSCTPRGHRFGVIRSRTIQSPSQKCGPDRDTWLCSLLVLT